MMWKRSRGIVWLAMIAVLLAASACGGGVRVGQLQTEYETVELGDVTPVQVQIDMGAGELEVAGGATELLEANFAYNVAELKPEIDYSGGRLAVRTPDVQTGIASFLDVDRFQYDWDLRLNDHVPMDMQVGVGAGPSTLRLGTLSLTSLEVAFGTGEVVIDLSGSPSLTRLNVGGGAGHVTVDLTGDWQNDLDATIEGGLGGRTLILPPDVGVRVKVEVGVGGVDASGLTKEGEYYTNDAYGQSGVTLNILVQGGVGQTDLRVGG
jgi:hypothetical protein